MNRLSIFFILIFAIAISEAATRLALLLDVSVRRSFFAALSQLVGAMLQPRHRWSFAQKFLYITPSVVHYHAKALPYCS